MHMLPILESADTASWGTTLPFYCDVEPFPADVVLMAQVAHVEVEATLEEPGADGGGIGLPAALEGETDVPC